MREETDYNFGMAGEKTTFVNFRDMGGLKTEDGGEIREGKLFRTAVIAPRTRADRNYLESIHLDCVVDLRNPEEIAENPDKLPARVEYVNAPVFENRGFNALAPTKKIIRGIFRSDEEELFAIKRQIAESYSVMPFEKKAYGEIFSRMDEGKTIAFHCTAGKDRTGVAAILIELALGRSAEECERQYLLSNELRKKEIDRTAFKMKFLFLKSCVWDFCQYAARTHGELFDTAMNSILSQYGSVFSFLSEVHGITPQRAEKWKSFYLK